MANVRVWNDNTHPYQETFREHKIQIPPKSFIMMEESEAQIFKGTFAPPKLDADGNDIPEGYKMIRIEYVQAPQVVQVAEHLCQACSYKGSSKSDLEAHIDANHLEIMADKDEQEKRAKAKAKTH